MFDVLPENQVAKWDEELKQYYVEYEEDGKTYKMWVENEKSVGEKINMDQIQKLLGGILWKNLLLQI